MRRTTKDVVALVVLLASAVPFAFGSAAASVHRARSLDGQKLEVAAVWKGTEEENFESVLSAFDKQTGASTTFTSTGDDISTALEPRIAGGDAPDVAILPQPGLLKDFAERGVLKPVEVAAGKEVDANYAPIWRQLGTVNRQLYGVWFKAANKSLVWYNAKVFSDAGVKPATTFDQLTNDMKTISESGVPPLSVGGSDGWTLTDIFENLYLAEEGPAKYDRLASHSMPWTDPSVSDTLRTMGKLVMSSNLAGGTSGTLQTDFPTSVQNMFGTRPKGAMNIEGDFVAAVVSGDTTAKVGRDAKFFPFPPDQRRPAVGGDRRRRRGDVQRHAGGASAHEVPGVTGICRSVGTARRLHLGQQERQADTRIRTRPRAKSRRTWSRRRRFGSTCPTSSRRPSARQPVRVSGSSSRTSSRTRATWKASPNNSSRRRPRPTARRSDRSPARAQRTDSLAASVWMLSYGTAPEPLRPEARRTVRRRG